MIFIKAGVTPRLLIIAAAIANVAQTLQLNVTITSGTDGKHMTGSKHYTGEALDVRKSNLTKAERAAFLAAVKQRLGKGYDVIDEPSHFHIEYDPT
jgi:hypothetical protein